MSPTRAERITGLQVVLQKDPQYGHRCRLFFENKGEPEILSITHRDPSTAVGWAVDANYHRVKERVFSEQKWHCFVCGVYAFQGLQCDHIKPRARGGRNDRRDNLRGVCPECHRKITDNIIKNPQPHHIVADYVLKFGWKWGDEKWVQV